MAGRRMDRRSFCRFAGGALIGAAAVSRAQAPREQFRLRYILASALADFIEKMKPHVAVAEDQSITIAIENHANSLVASVDSIRRFAEMIPSNHLGLALAPYHLPQDADLLADLIRHTGPRLAHFYAWQYGRGCHEPLSKEQELLQMPGRGLLDFRPLIAALADINYQGWTEIFMHPVPRGIPIFPTAAKVTGEINHSRRYLEECVATAERTASVAPGQKRENS